MTENNNQVKSLMEILFRRNCIRTASGNFINFLHPDPDTFTIEDIAHGLANERRWANQIPEPNQGYTVAQHSLLASELADEPHKFAALMHDAFEAYGRDASSPMKELLRDYKIIEDRFMRVIAAKFGFEYPKHPHVEKIDKFLLHAEGEQLMAKRKIIFPNMPIYDFATAKANFLYRFYELTNPKKVIAVPAGTIPIVNNNSGKSEPDTQENKTTEKVPILGKEMELVNTMAPPIKDGLKELVTVSPEELTGQNNNSRPEPEPLPPGFRYIEEGEVLPAGPYEIHMDLASSRQITNAPKKSDTVPQTILIITEGKKNGTEFLHDKANDNYIKHEWENGELKKSQFITQPEYERGVANHITDTIVHND